MKFVKRPVVIEAVQYNGRNSEEIYSFMGCPAGEIEEDFLGDYLIIKTLEGDMKASKNDWIIRGVSGEFYPCKPHIFEATYTREGADDNKN